MEIAREDTGPRPRKGLVLMCFYGMTGVRTAVNPVGMKKRGKRGRPSCRMRGVIGERRGSSEEGRSSVNVERRE